MRPPPAVLLHCFAVQPGTHDPIPRARETADWIISHLPALKAAGITYAPRPMLGEFDYYNAFLALWLEPVTILNLEHDLVPELETVLGMRYCAYPACSGYYRLGEDRDRVPMVFVERSVWDPGNNELYMSADSAHGGPPEWADRVGFGLMKLDFGTRIRHPLPAAPVPWLSLDSTYSSSIKAREPCFKWHVHGPEARHNH